MKAEDIVLQLAKTLPSFSDLFTSNFSVSSLTQVGGVVTVTTTSAHNFEVSDGVFITGASTPLLLDTFTRSGTLGTLVTLEDHDITKGSQDTVMCSGAVEAEFNGNFTILSVPNRKTLIVSMADSGPTSATGAPQLDNGSSCLQTYNGLQEITAVPTSTSFQYILVDDSLLNPLGTITARGKARIASALDLEGIIAAYTKKATTDLWLFVSLGDSSASRDRNTQSDAV